MKNPHEYHRRFCCCDHAIIVHSIAGAAVVAHHHHFIPVPLRLPPHISCIQWLHSSLPESGIQIAEVPFRSSTMVTSPSRARPTTWWASATPSSSCRRCGTTTSEHAPSGNPHKRTHTRPCTYEYPVHPLTHNCYLQQVIAAALHLLPRPCLLMVSTGRLWYHHSIACGVWRCCQSWRDRDGGSHDMPSLIAAVQAQEVETATVTLFHPLMCILHTCLILYSMCAFHSKPCFLAMQQTGLLSH